MKPSLPPINPSKRSVVPVEPELTEKGAHNIVRFFVLLLLVPLAFELAAPFTPAKVNQAVALARSGMQWVLVHGLTEGNRAVFLGRESWLFDQRDLERLVHAKREGNVLKANLLELAAQLKKGNTPLLVITIPSRATLYPEKINPGSYTRPVRLESETGVVSELKAAGIDILDMTDALWEFRERQQAFFAHDSHWTPEAMKAVALAVNKHVRGAYPRVASDETPIINATILENLDAGDLANELDPMSASNLMGVEGADLISIQDLEPDAKSSIVLHGDSLMRVFDDAACSFGDGGSNPHAGFATQLGTLLNRRIDVRGLPKPDETYQDKKLVICLIPMAELAP